MAKVSILCPYYNRQNAIRQTIRSIATQTFTDFEAIIWDDASTDQTWRELCNIRDEFADSRFRFLRYRQNVGLTAGLNRGLQIATGQYVAIVGSGDECAADRIEKQVCMLDASDAIFAACRSRTIDENTGDEFFDEHFHKTVISREDIRTGCPFTHGSVVYRRHALESIGGYDEIFKWCADWDVFFRLLNRGNAIFIPEILYTRYARQDGASFNPQKSFEQIQNKHLVLQLADTCPQERTKVKESIRQNGFVHTLSARESSIVRDLRYRQIKLILMQRYAAATELDRLTSFAHGRSLYWSGLILIAKLMSWSPVGTNQLIQASRNVRAFFAGAVGSVHCRRKAET